jgi:hypothetical protein
MVAAPGSLTAKNRARRRNRELKTIGVIEVIALAATAAVMPVATSIATGTRTNSAASAGRRS